MRNRFFAFLLLVNGLILGLIAGLLLGRPGQPTPARFRLDRSDGQIAFFDQVTGHYIAFRQQEDLWFVMVYDPVEGSVTYRETRLIEDPSFLEAAQRLKHALPRNLGRELQLDRLGTE